MSDLTPDMLRARFADVTEYTSDDERFANACADAWEESEAAFRIAYELIPDLCKRLDAAEKELAEYRDADSRPPAMKLIVY